MIAVVVAGATGTTGVLVDRPGLRIVAAHEQDGASTAAREIASGAAQVELCGTLGPLALAEVVAEHPDARAGVVMFAAGPASGSGRRAVLFLGPTLDPFADRIDGAGVVLLPVPDDQSAGVVAAQVAAEGVTRFELVAGLGIAAAANVLMAVPGSCAVGLVLYP